MFSFTILALVIFCGTNADANDPGTMLNKTAPLALNDLSVQDVDAEIQGADVGEAPRILQVKVHSDVDVECLKNRSTTDDSVLNMWLAVAEIQHAGYRRILRPGTWFYYGVALQGIAFLMQLRNVIRANWTSRQPGTSQNNQQQPRTTENDPTVTTSEQPRTPERKREQPSCFIQNPQVMRFLLGWLSVSLLDSVYGSLYVGEPLGVFNVNRTEIDHCGVPTRHQYGVIAANAKKAIEQGAADTCTHFPAHVSVCDEKIFRITKDVLRGGGDDCKDDPLIVQKHLYEGGSAFFIQMAFFIGCTVRLFDAITDYVFDTWKPKPKWNSTAKIMRKAAWLRGYKRDYNNMEVLKKGLYDETNPFYVEWFSKRLNATSKMISQMASDALYSVLTMMGLQINVYKGCMTMNTTLSFTVLAFHAYVFMGIALISFGVIGIIMLMHFFEGIYESIRDQCDRCRAAQDTDDADEHPAKHTVDELDKLKERYGCCKCPGCCDQGFYVGLARLLCHVYAICCMILTLLSAGGYIFTLVLVFTNSNLGIRGNLGVITDFISIILHWTIALDEAVEEKEAETVAQP